MFAAIIGSFVGASVAAVGSVFWFSPQNGSGSPPLRLVAQFAMVIAFFSLWVTIPAAAFVGITAGFVLSPSIARAPVRSLGLIVVIAVVVPIATLTVIENLRTHGVPRDQLFGMVLSLPFSVTAALAYCVMLWRARHRLAA